jgi:ribonuclease HII
MAKPTSSNVATAQYEHTHQHRAIGVDEVGRGPWAGPVIAAAVWLPPGLYDAGFQDSKKLTSAKREALYQRILAEAHYGLGEASVQEIDQLNILQATMLAMKRAVQALITQCGELPAIALIDGNRTPKDLPCPAQALVKGDAISVSIAAASILAKVTRDRMMQQLHVEFPHYGWASNAGYGTAAHQQGLRSHGVCDHHRRSFAPIRTLLMEQAA